MFRFGIKQGHLLQFLPVEVSSYCGRIGQLPCLVFTGLLGTELGSPALRSETPLPSIGQLIILDVYQNSPLCHPGQVHLHPPDQ